MVDWENVENEAVDSEGESITPEASNVLDGGVEVLAILEAMLFASPEPLGVDEIAAALGVAEAGVIEESLDRLGRALRAPERGLSLEKVAGGYRLVTRPELAAPLRALFRFRNQRRLTPATLDVLAIVAYAQPITAPEIQEIRGADPAYALKALLERKLIRIVGRKRVVGRPILYGTTREFLLHFGLDSLEDLPSVEGYGTQVVPAQGRLFPVTERQDDVVPYEDDGEDEADARTSDAPGIAPVDDPSIDDRDPEDRRDAGARRGDDAMPKPELAARAMDPAGDE
ncbi:MAG: SMC-Scp complex subunit ScpB [Acidobacteria bacterium]|nr:SMC-Scp complex subunit ScpB [Acidobacteriota bacterium]